MTSSPTAWSVREGVTLPLIGKVPWATLKRATIKWLLNPRNFALLVWMIAVVVAGAILFMVMVGMLNPYQIQVTETRALKSRTRY